MQEIISRVDVNLQNKREKILITSVNAAIFITSLDNKLITDCINSSDIVNIDGMSVYFSLKMLGIQTPERVAGPDVFYNLVKLAANKGYKPYFLGAKPKVVDAMVKRFNSEFPGLKIAGFYHGYFHDNSIDTIIKNIEESNADMLFLGIASPKREIFTNNYFHSSSVPVWKGVGGSFDIYANITKRAPFWIQGIGMEWFYRLCQEPGRMFKRYLVTNTLFIVKILCEFCRKVFKSKTRVFWE